MGIMDLIGVGKDLAEPIKAVGTLYTTDKERLDAEENLAETTQKPQLAQLETNKVFANSLDFFTRAWQPMLGWSCGFLILVYYAPQIIIYTYLWVHLCVETDTIRPFPMSPTDLLNLVYLLFGFGTHSIAQQVVSTVGKSK
jgi:hypothetical protein